MTIVHSLIEERTDPRLGRHQVHDERSRQYAMAAPTNLPTRVIMHKRYAPIWDQGQIGSCTANAALGMLVTGSLWRPSHSFLERDCLELYREETRLDDRVIPGHYEPDDTGSAGIYSCKAMRNRALISSYWHAFTSRTVLAMLGKQAVSIGIPWYESMFQTDAAGNVKMDPGSGLAGGHQVCMDGIDPNRRVVRFANSWGPNYGAQGWGYLTWDQLTFLLQQGGDAVTVTL